MSRSTNTIDTYWEKVDYEYNFIEEIVSTIRNNGVYVGEQDAEELEECLLNPETRNVAQIIVSDEKEAFKLLDILMGTNVTPRKEYVLKYAEDARV